MVTLIERPELRTDFKHPDLRAHVRENRGPFLSAALTILRGWVVSGKPQHGLPASGSFEGWSSVVREAIVFAGLPDPGARRDAWQTASDRDAAAMAAMLDHDSKFTGRLRRWRTGRSTGTLRACVPSCLGPMAKIVAATPLIAEAGEGQRPASIPTDFS